MSISHWGIFEVPMPPIMLIPPHFKLTEEDLKALRSPGHIVVMDREQLELNPIEYRRAFSL